MLAQLTTIKDRLSIAPATTTYDTLLTTAIKAVSARFDKLTNRTLARAVEPHSNQFHGYRVGR